MDLTIIEDESFESGLNSHHEIIHVSGNVYAIVSISAGLVGQLHTVTINSSGVISTDAVDSFTWGNGTAAQYVRNPRIINVSGDIYALVYIYGNSPRSCVLMTIEIDSTGNIGAATIDTLVITADGSSPSIVHVSGEIYAISYRDGDVHGWVSTIDIDSSGNIGVALIDNHEFDTSQAFDPHIINISGTTYAIAYRGVDMDGWLKTLTIGNDGSITADPELDSLEFDTDYCSYPFILNVSGDIFVISYYADNGVYKLATVSISSVGVIGIAVLDTLTLISNGSSAAVPVKIIEVATGYYAIAYEGFGNDGFLACVTIETDGSIGDSVTQLLEFNTSTGNDPSPILVTYGVFGIVAVAYGTTSAGRVVTIGRAGKAAYFPSDPTTRVTSIIHRYDRGVYNTELLFGDVISDFSIPNVDSSTTKTYQSKEELDKINKAMPAPIPQPITIIPTSPVQPTPSPSTVVTPTSQPPTGIVELTQYAKDILATPAGQAAVARQQGLTQGVEAIVTPYAIDILKRNEQEAKLLTQIQKLTKAASATGITSYARSVLIKAAIDAKAQLKELYKQ